jgi:hypothetical protein
MRNGLPSRNAPPPPSLNCEFSFDQCAVVVQQEMDTVMRRIGELFVGSKR